MLEAVTTDLVFTISLKRSTQNLQLSTSWAGRLPHLCPGISDINLLRYCQGVIDLDAEVSDRVFDFGMPEQFCGESVRPSTSSADSSMEPSAFGLRDPAVQQLDDGSRAVARIAGKRSILNSSFPRRSL